MINPHTNEFAAFWAKNFDTPCPPVPKKLDDLNITAREAMRMENPVLFQNLFRQQDMNQMPADVVGRMQNQTFWASDIPILRRYGYEHQARELEKQIELEKAKKPGYWELFAAFYYKDLNAPEYCRLYSQPSHAYKAIGTACLTTDGKWERR